MPRPYPPEFRARAVALVRAGKPIRRVAAELGIREGGLHSWGRQDQIDRGERPGLTTPVSAEAAKARKRIRQLEMEVEILKRVAQLLGEDRPDPKGSTRRSENFPAPGSPRSSVAGCWA